jgi:hypothetical protein
MRMFIGFLEDTERLCQLAKVRRSDARAGPSDDDAGHSDA